MSQAIPVEQLKSLTMSIYRFDPSVDEKPYMQDIVIEVPTDKDIMVLDALLLEIHTLFFYYILLS